MSMPGYHCCSLQRLPPYLCFLCPSGALVGCRTILPPLWVAHTLGNNQSFVLAIVRVGLGYVSEGSDGMVTKGQRNLRQNSVSQ